MVEEWSTPVWVVLAASVVAVLLLAALAGATLWAGARARRLQARVVALEELAAALLADQRAERSADQRAEQPTEQPTDERAQPAGGYVITTVGAPAEPAPAVPAPLFADLVLRESVVRGAAWAAGLRRALSPEVRHRIRFEMRREVKRSRRSRRADLRQARRAQASRTQTSRTQGSAA